MDSCNQWLPTHRPGRINIVFKHYFMQTVNYCEQQPPQYSGQYTSNVQIKLAKAAEVWCVDNNALSCNLSNLVVCFTADEETFIFQLLTTATHPNHLISLCTAAHHHTWCTMKHTQYALNTQYLILICVIFTSNYAQYNVTIKTSQVPTLTSHYYYYS